MYRKDSPSTIQSMFNSIAPRYDLTNSILSFSLHKIWNRSLVKRILNREPNPSHFVDLCAGTGDIAFELLKKSPISKATLIDFSKEMLAKAKQKEPPGSPLAYIEADVHLLPLSNECADCAGMAYGIRNVQHPADCLREVHRILKPGGTFGILELTRPKLPLFQMGHRLYLTTLLPLFGRLCTRNQDAYRYLSNSIDTFIDPQEIENLMKNEGFIETARYSLMGGIATIITGNKAT